MPEGYKIPEEGFFSRTAVELAPRLIGCILARMDRGGRTSGIIVETEAYTEDDPASHSFRGRTGRNWPMFDKGGLAYVYLIYGMHNCFNVTAGQKGRGEAVLVRALKPLEGIELMRENRGVENVLQLCSGPGRLCQAMGIDRRHNGQSLLGGDLTLSVPVPPLELPLDVTRRVGITKASERKLRFCLSGSKWVSARSQR